MKPHFVDLFPDYCSLLLSGPPGVGKLDYLLGALRSYLEAGASVLFVCVDVGPREVASYFRRAGEDISAHEGKQLIFVDCFTPSVSGDSGGGVGVLPVSSFSNLEGIGMAIAKGAERLGPPVKILFYTVSTLFLHNSSQSLSKFFQIVSSRVKTQMGMILYAAHEGVHDERQERLQRSLVDGVVEMRFNEEMQREIRLHHLRGHQVEPRWQPCAPDVEPPKAAVAAPGIWSVGEGGEDG